jgi:glycosyltransferase involved in cell wall biosynthesis
MPQMRNLFPVKNFSKKILTDFYEKQYLIGRYKKCENNFIAISKDTHAYFLDVLPQFLHKIEVLHNAIDYNKFYAPKEKKCSQTIINLVCVGSLVDKKNQIFLVDIALALKQKNVNVSINILGDGPNKEKIKSRVLEQDLQNEIILHGNVEEVQHFLNIADIYIHVATYEPFGLVLLEAMAAGLPIVTLDGKGNRDIMIDGHNGFMIVEQDANLFAEKIIYLQSDTHKYRIISENAKKFAEKYDIANYIDDLLLFYRN